MGLKEIVHRCEEAVGWRLTRVTALANYRITVIEEALTGRYGEVSLDESRYLSALAGGLSGAGPIIEIGTLFGASTLALVRGKDPSRPLITVDDFCWNPFNLPVAAHRRITQKNLAEAIAKYNVTLVEMDKTRFYRTYEGVAPAMVFIDDGHDYEHVVEDIVWARQAGARVISGHDYAASMPGVVRAVDEAGGPRLREGTLWVL